MKQYTDADRLSWVSFQEPRHDFCHDKESKGEEDAHWISFWDNSIGDHAVITGRTYIECVDKAMEYCRIKRLVQDEYDSFFTITLGDPLSANEKTYAFKLPYPFEEVDALYDSYLATVRAISLRVHDEGKLSGISSVFDESGVISERHQKWLLEKHIFVESAVQKSDALMLDLIGQFISQSGETVILQAESVPDEILPYLPSFNYRDIGHESLFFK